jgi:UDP-glucose 4-epimerase
MEPTRVSDGQVLITGGSGTLGSYIINALKPTYDVVIADLERPTDVVDAKFTKLDLRQPFTISNDFEICIHLAAHVGGIQYFSKHPVENIRDNPRMTANMFDAVTDSNIKQVIYTSSSVVYQNQLEFPTSEESVANSPPPTSAYGMSKLVGELMCKAYNEQYGVKYTILRPFNLYGPKEVPDPDYAHVIPELIHKVLSGQYPVEIYGNGKQTRTFTHGSDAARAFILCIHNNNAVGETFNVSGNEEIEIKHVLELIWDLTGHTQELKITNLPAFPHDVQRRYPSNKKIKERIGWEPKIDFVIGLRETIEYIQTLRN